MITDKKNSSLPLLTVACRHHWGMEVLPPMVKGQWGKPSFQLEGRHFNLSHSGNIALCCLGSTPIGVDIQLPRPSRPNFLDKISTPAQRQWLRDFGDSQEAFALLWAMTESYYKLTGRGIPLPFTPMEFPLPASLPDEQGWSYCAMDDVIFSLTKINDGMVSLCSTQRVTTKIIDFK